MAGPISAYWATVGIKTDNEDIRKVDEFLAKVERKLAATAGKKGLRVNLYIDEDKFHKHINGVFKRAGKATPFKLSNVTIDATTLTSSVKAVLSVSHFKAPITAVLSQASVQTLRGQLQAALQGITIGVRTGSVASRASGGSRGTGSEAERRRASLSGRGDPSLPEQWMGKPGKSSLSAGNRRYYDAMVGKAYGGVGGNSLTGLAVQGGLGGLARVGSGSFLGRVAASTGMSLGGAAGGATGLAISGVISLAGQAFTGIWSSLGTIITAPFKLISGAASAVTSAFYRIALAAVPLVMGFSTINKNVQQVTSRNIALDTTSGRFGSNATTEKKWLMEMANREGMSYNTMIDPYTSYMAAAAPTLGLEKTRSAFEAFNQYGSTHGATKESSGRALYAFSQMASKGTVMSEELC